MMSRPIIRNLGLQPYQPVYNEMLHFTQTRNNNTPDEIWLVEHFPVYTQGKSGKPEHLLRSTEIPVIQTDRGGQITYHGPGQQVMYILLDLKRAKVGIRDVVTFMESSIISVLADFSVVAYAKKEAPGVYINEKKISSLGLSIKRGCTLHGLALNIDMDLTPFKSINPCGYPFLEMTQLKEYVTHIDRNKINELLINYFICQFPINSEANNK